jgi:hypothetical protein
LATDTRFHRYLGYLSTNAGPILGASSTLARAFTININNVRVRSNHAKTTTDDYLIGVAEGLEVLLDHILGSTGAAQIKLAGDSKFVPANI